MDKLKAAIFKSTAETLENMAFMECQRCEFFWGAIDITSPIKGKIFISFTDLLARKYTKGTGGKGRKRQEVLESTEDLVQAVANDYLKGCLGDTAIQYGETSSGIGSIDTEGLKIFQDYYELDGKAYIVTVAGEELYSMAEKYKSA